MTPTESAILRTLLYADVFNFPMTLREIHHFLIADQPMNLDQIAHTLQTSPSLKTAVASCDGYFFLRGREEILSIRHQREQASEPLWSQAMLYGVWLARLPFVRMVALTGALSMRNAAHGDDDLDYVVVTSPGRVWLARGCAVLLVRLARLRGVVICPNYVMAETALEQDRHDLFMAHEVAQMVPIYGWGVYEKMRAANRWVDFHLPNAETTFYAEDERRPGRLWGTLKRVLEVVLCGWLGEHLEGWERARKLDKFAAGLQTPYHAAKLDEENVKGHFHDHGHPIMQKYHQRLAEYNLLDNYLPMAGD